MEVKTGYCPFCEGLDCAHWLGWTEDGKTIIAPSEWGRVEENGEYILHKSSIPRDAIIITTGVTARVYLEKTDGIVPLLKEKLTKFGVL